MGRTGPKNMPGSGSLKVRTPSVKTSRPSAHSVRNVSPVKPPSGGGKKAGVAPSRPAVKSTPHTGTKRSMPTGAIRSQMPKKI